MDMETLTHKQFITDKNGHKRSVILPIREYNRLLKAAEMAEVLTIIREGEKEHSQGRLKPIRSLSELDRD